jgi:predicted ABC-type ATPase
MIKTYTIFAGVNGAGKSSFYKAMDADFGIRINLDEIIRHQFKNDWNNVNVQMSAGRLAVKLIRDCLNGNGSFNQETTLTGKTILSTIKKAKQNGFLVHLFYVGLESAELSIERVAKRVAQGGHGIPTSDLIRRYSNSFENLKLALPLCDKVQIYDNSGKNYLDVFNPLLIVQYRKVVIWDKNAPKYLKDILESYISMLGSELL